MFKFIFYSALLILLTSCQIGYITKNAFEQIRIIKSQVPIEKALENPDLTEVQKNKLRLSVKAKHFAMERLHLKSTKNYSGYTHLDRDHVSYVVSAAEKWTLTPHLWSYPFFGKMPYKGYFNISQAEDEKAHLEKQNLDVYLRGVSAYSTLGWFKDPVLSSMLRYPDHQLVNTIIHEMTHTTIYIKNNADFNERLAMFVGNKGMELFYIELEGAESATVKLAQLENHDDQIFSEFISNELESLKKWYEELPEADRTQETKDNRIKKIQSDFEKNVLAKLKTNNYKNFPKIQLNNARLLVYRTYMSDLSDFEKLYTKSEGDWAQFFKYCSALEKSRDPAAELKALLLE